ncbi:hypothetical protein ACJX0J_039968, partial [Zea mays]
PDIHHQIREYLLYLGTRDTLEDVWARLRWCYPQHFRYMYIHTPNTLRSLVDLIIAFLFFINLLSMYKKIHFFFFFTTNKKGKFHMRYQFLVGRVIGGGGGG